MRSQVVVRRAAKAKLSGPPRAKPRETEMMSETTETKEAADVGGSRLERIVMPSTIALDVMLSSRCTYCGKPAEGSYSIHRDGFGEGPEVPLCDACGGGRTPTLAEIWARIAEA